MLRLPVVLFLVVLCPSYSLATGIAMSTATLDWTDFSYTLSAGISVTGIQNPYQNNGSSSTVLTTLGGRQDAKDIVRMEQGLIPMGDWTTTSVAASFSNDRGNVSGQASTANGFIATSLETAVTSQDEEIRFAGGSQAETGQHFVLFGTGSGTLTVTVPYMLFVACSVDDSFNATSVSASSSVLLRKTGAAGWSDGSAQASSSCTGNGSESKTGMLAISGNVNLSPSGQLVLIDVTATSTGVAQVSETSSLVLLVLGLAGVFAVKFRRFA
jgi:hypothetical protein